MWPSKNNKWIIDSSKCFYKCLYTQGAPTPFEELMGPKGKKPWIWTEKKLQILSFALKYWPENSIKIVAHVCILNTRLWPGHFKSWMRNICIVWLLNTIIRIPIIKTIKFIKGYCFCGAGSTLWRKIPRENHSVDSFLLEIDVGINGTNAYRK